jgi:Regulator of chromosome condensation (RCC1) repeat
MLRRHVTIWPEHLATLRCRTDRYEPFEINVAEPGKPKCNRDRVVFVAAGGRHSCAIVSHAGRLAIKATGGNNYGQLGLGDTVDRKRCDFFASPALSAWLMGVTVALF